MSVICIDEILEKDQQRQKALELDELEELDEYELWDLQADEILNGSGSEILCWEQNFCKRCLVEIGLVMSHRLAAALLFTFIYI